MTAAKAMELSPNGVRMKRFQEAAFCCPISGMGQTMRIFGDAGIRICRVLSCSLPLLPRSLRCAGQTGL